MTSQTHPEAMTVVLRDRFANDQEQRAALQQQVATTRSALSTAEAQVCLPNQCRTIPRPIKEEIPSRAAVLFNDDILLSCIFPFLDMKELGLLVAPVCQQWSFISRKNDLWKPLAEKSWSSTETLIIAGVLTFGTNYRAFCRSRIEYLPTIVKQLYY